MITKTANVILNQPSPGQAIYDMMRHYRRGARYGVTLAPVVNDKKQEQLKAEVQKASDKLDKIKALKEQNKIQIKPITTA